MSGHALHRFLHDRSGNIAVVFALVLVPAAGLLGLAVDFSIGSKKKALLDAIADAASLAAVTPQMLSQTDAASITAATTMFNSQSASISGIGPITLSVKASDSGLSRTVTVTYQTTTNLSFGKLLGVSTMALTGLSQSTSSVPPNIDFYLLLDNSPSMAIAATTAGINTMVANTSDQCAFGCHESDTSPNDYYGLARSLNVTLRMDLVAQATQNLMSTAKATEANNNANYRAAIYTFNYGFNTISSLTSNLTTAQTRANGISIYEVPYQNWNNDTMTNYTTAMNQINSILPSPGNGTSQAGDTPQEVLFFVTDGVEDETVGTARVQSPMDPSYCTTIKNRGIRIAVLYTQYLPLPTNAWYNQYIGPYQPTNGVDQIGLNLQNCASPGLYFEVTTDQDISAAMVKLFDEAVATAHLTK